MPLPALRAKETKTAHARHHAHCGQKGKEAAEKCYLINAVGRGEMFDDHKQNRKPECRH
jgi:hypothetical protein